MGAPWSPVEPLSVGEVHFLWHFIQGSIMVPATRWRLRRAWGMCERHSFGSVAVEAAFRPHLLHGPAILYADLMTRAVRAFAGRGPFQHIRIAWRLRDRGPCLMCEIGYGPQSPGIASAELIEQGRDLAGIRAFAERTAPVWRPMVCGRCAATDEAARCRRHLREDLLAGATGLASHRQLVATIAEHILRYERSFRWEYRGTDTQADRAALIAAVGWCSGWRPWLGLIGERADELAPAGQDARHCRRSHGCSSA
jgi:hypothetical protein